MSIRKNQKISLAAIPVGLAALVYLAGIVSQFIRNTQAWKAAGGIPGIGAPPAFPSFALGDVLSSCVRDWYGLAGLGLCLAVFAFFIFGVLHIDLKGGGKLDRERNFSFSRKGTYGTAAFMDKQEIARVLHLEKSLEDTSETILGKVDNRIITVPADSSMNRNIAVCGSPGSRKSRSFTRNMILQCVRRGESLIITDSKGEIYSDFAEYLKESGYQVRVFNSDRPNCSDSWDLLGEVQGDPLMAELIASVMIANTGVGKDPFWDGAEQNLLKAVLLYPIVVYTKQLDDGSRKVMEIIEGQGYRDGELQYRTLYRFETARNLLDDKGNIKKVQGRHRQINPISKELRQRMLENGITEAELKEFSGTEPVKPQKPPNPVTQRGNDDCSGQAS